jgi:transposase
MKQTTLNSTSAASKILAIDLGKFKSVACTLEPTGGEHQFETITTSPSAMHDLLAQAAPGVLVIEACSIAGWVFDLARTLGIDVKVANTFARAIRRP